MLAGAMESATLKEMSSWRNRFKEYFAHKKLLIYDPVDQEVCKVDCEAKDQHEQLTILKREKRNKEFFKVLWKIWFGQMPVNSDLVDVLKKIRLDKHAYGNNTEDMNAWGDAEAVVRSDFIVVYLPDSSKTVGTYYEVCLALLFNIPIYLIIPDVVPKDESEIELERINSCLLFALQLSGGRLFGDLEGCMKYVRRKYF